ncbi:hypothetical protein [Paenibacillus sp. y28]|uniref:hypothetical protein n=1 Tax=Paenibacillus sp. y28 TaxID=3129110 RepID=UPI0030182B1C
MNFTFEKVLGIGITALLVAALLLAPNTGLKSKAETSHTKASTKIDAINEEFN